jgi:hypothetical protein
MFTGMRISTQEWNLVAQLEAVFAVAARILREGGRPNLCLGNDLGGQGTPSIVGGKEEGLKCTLGEAMDKGEDEKSQGNPVEGYPQILQGDEQWSGGDLWEDSRWQ